MPEMSGGLDGMMVTSFLWYMCTEFESKMAVQSLSQICPTDSSEPEASFGKACDLVVAVVRCWIGSCAVAVDVIILTLGTMT